MRSHWMALSKNNEILSLMFYKGHWFWCCNQLQGNRAQLEIKWEDVERIQTRFSTRSEYQ